jgi:hypothetical protein
MTECGTCPVIHGPARFVCHFLSAWVKVMEPDRLDLKL